MVGLIEGRIDVNLLGGAILACAKLAAVAMMFHVLRTTIRVASRQAERYNYLIAVLAFAVIVPVVVLQNN